MNDRTIPNLRMSLTNHLVLSGPEERDLLAILDEVELLRDEVKDAKALSVRLMEERDAARAVCRLDPAWCNACEATTGSERCAVDPLRTKCEMCACVRG